MKHIQIKPLVNKELHCNVRNNADSNDEDIDCEEDEWSSSDEDIDVQMLD